MEIGKVLGISLGPCTLQSYRAIVLVERLSSMARATRFCLGMRSCSSPGCLQLTLLPCRTMGEGSFMPSIDPFRVDASSDKVTANLNYLINGHSLSDSGRKASSPGMVASTL